MIKKIKVVYLEVFYTGDSSEFHELMRQILSQAPFQVFTLINEKANLEQIVALKPNMILMDLRRRESPNLELHREIAESEEVDHLPILIITEKGYDSTPLGFGYTHVDDYVCYPFFDEVAFFSIVENLLRRAEAST